MALAASETMPFRSKLLVGDEEVVANQLDPGAEFSGQRLPSLPVGLGHPVLDRNERELVDQRREIVDHFRRGHGPALELVAAPLEQLGGGHIESEGHLIAQAIAGCLDPFRQKLQGCPVGGEVGSETAFVPDIGLKAAPGQDFLEGLVALDPGPQRLRDRWEARRGRS